MATRSAACVMALALTVGLDAQQQPGIGASEAEARRVAERIALLQAEADQLAGEARTLLGDLRRLEVERALQVARVAEAQDAIERGRMAIQQSSRRLAELEHERAAQLPDLETQLVDMYKRGRAGYARLLFGSSGVREFGRATRAVAALMRLNQQRLARHQATLASLQRERAALTDELRTLEAREQQAREARAAADRAVAARNALVAEIDARRDLNAQMAGELQVAAEQLQARLAAVGPARAVEVVAVPLAPFRGALEWPTVGRLTSRFGEPGRFGSPATANGVEIAAPGGAPVRAIHPGTVSFAGAFAGFGNLVVLDHGGNAYSLYGYLETIEVARGQAVASGAELGQVGAAPAGPTAVYLEIRVDGQSVDPVQWLKPR